MKRHAAAGAEIAAQVKNFTSQNLPFRITHGSTNSTRLSTRRSGHTVDTSSLHHVLKVDRVKKIALVEPNVPMDKLVDCTLKYGLVPPVVMEFPGITVGGGYSGTSGESSSFRHGFFDQTIESVEMVLGNGEVVRASESEREDLFRGAAGALGTLGVTTAVELRLKEAKGWVETKYTRVGGMEEAVKVLKEITAAAREDGGVDYVDGILFAKDHGVIVTGRLTDEVNEDLPKRTFTGAWDPWFYLHAKDVTKKKATETPTELVPIYDYMFRYDRGGFWVGRSAFHYMLSFPFNRLTRWFLDDFMRTRMMYKALHASGYSRQYIVQDLALPYDTATDFVQWAEDRTGIWPLWLCPLKQSPGPTMHPHLKDSATSLPSQQLAPMLNIGLWGFGPSDPQKFESLNLELESKLHELGGMKWLYATTYYTETDFWNMFDKNWYDALRTKYSATTLPSVYDKVKRSQVPTAQEKERQSEGWKMRILKVRPLGGFYGIWKAIWSGEWRNVKRGTWESIEPIEEDGKGEGQGKKER